MLCKSFAWASEEDDKIKKKRIRQLREVPALKRLRLTLSNLLCKLIPTSTEIAMICIARIAVTGVAALKVDTRALFRAVK